MKTQNTNTRKVIVAAIGLLIGGSLSAQQTPLSNFYNFNEYLLNPAEAGANNFIEGTASHRIQWQGIEGAPTTTFFGLNGALNDKMGIGAKINVDQTDILKQFNAAISYAYRIKLNEKANLSFGLSGMMVQNSVGYGDAVVGDLADEVVNGGNENGMAFDAEAGIMLQYQKFRFGVASANLFETGVGYNLPDDRGEGTFERVRLFSAYTSYEFDLSDNWTLEPFVLVRNQGVESFQFEVNALTTWKETLHLGLGFRQEAGLIGRVGFQITDQIVAAYAYEMGVNGVASYSNGSHEFMLGYKLASRSKKGKEINKELVPEPIVQKVKEEKPKEVEKVVEPIVEKVFEKGAIAEPIEVQEEIVEEEMLVDIAALNDEFNQRKNMIRYALQSSEESVSQNETRVINQAVELLNANPKLKLLIEGHSCDRGKEQLNQKLSAMRAERVMQLILSRGIEASRLNSVGKGESDPLVQNKTESDRLVNRRVQLKFSYE